MASGAPRRAIIIGGSIGGLFAALFLRRQGWDATVFERVPTPLASRGAGIITHPELRAILERLGLDAERDFGVAVEERVTLGADGRVIGSFPCAQVATSWDRLFRMLRAAFPDECYRHAAELSAIEQHPDGVRAIFADGRQAAGDLLIGADGVRSMVRHLLAPEIAPVYAGYVAWRGLLAESAVAPDIFGRFSFCLPPGEQMLGYPVAGENNDLRPGHRRFNFVWYRPADEAGALPDLLTDARGQTHSLSIPPPLIRPEVTASMREAARRTLAPIFANVVAATALPFLQPIYDLESTRIAWDRVALLGDAAFVVRPHVGAGVTKAAEDAASLAAALANAPGLPAALERYQSERLPAGRRLLRRGRHLGAYMQAQQSTDEERQAAARHHTPAAVMTETALLDF
ncbi:MAG: FAD-dependent monooxygenase [Acetobacteraceae bacterium]|nr:FAD-dependent monooxygenase [Acetobacteraceae bacterium]